MFDHHNRCCHEYSPSARTIPVSPGRSENCFSAGPRALCRWCDGETSPTRAPTSACLGRRGTPPTTTTTHRLRALLFRPPPPTSPLRLREAGLAASGASELSSPPPRVFNIIFQGFANLPVLRKNQPATPFCSFFPVTTQFGKLLITLLLLDTMCPWHLIQRYNINRKDC